MAGGRRGKGRTPSQFGASPPPSSPVSAPLRSRGGPGLSAASLPPGSSSRCHPCGCTRSPASPTATAASRTPPPASHRRCATPCTPPWEPSPAPCASRAVAEVKQQLQSPLSNPHLQSPFSNPPSPVSLSNPPPISAAPSGLRPSTAGTHIPAWGGLGQAGSPNGCSFQRAPVCSGSPLGHEQGVSKALPLGACRFLRGRRQTAPAGGRCRWARGEPKG